MITFNKANVTPDPDIHSAIWDWLSDNAENFGALPMDFVYEDADGCETVFSYDEMLSTLSQDQLDTLDKLIDNHNTSEVI